MNTDGLREELAAAHSRSQARIGQEKVEARFLDGIATMVVDAAPTEPEEPARLADLLDEVAHLISRYTRLPVAAFAMLIACWIANTYLYERFRYCGYLALRSATPRCGKSRVLQILAQLVAGHPSINANPTAATLFRSSKKVLVLDEVDRLRNADKENFGTVMAILNVGFERGAAVERVEKAKGGQFEVKEFPVYRPVALAGIESLADTVADRCFNVQMERAADRLPRFSTRVLEDFFAQVRQSFQGWSERFGDQVETAYDNLPDQLGQLQDFDDRFQDIAEPLVVIAAVADAERPDGPAVTPRLLKGLAAAAGRREPSGRERELLAFLEIVDPILNGADEVFVASSHLVEQCQGREELSRIETARGLAGLLKHFDLFPKSHSGKTRGYDIRRDWVSTWGARYGR